MGCFGRDNVKKNPVSSGDIGTGTNSGSHVTSDSSIKSNGAVDPVVSSEPVVQSEPVLSSESVVSPEPVAIESPGTKLLPSGSLRKPNDLKDFTFHELRYATKNFDRRYLLGEGGFGQVFRGTIKQKQKFGGGEEKIDVAVKQLNSRGQQGHKEWLAEVHFLGLVDSPHLVKLIGYCANDDDERGIQRLLVYEFMQNKGLDDHLFRQGPTSLSWSSRVKIVLGAARGLAYLHEDLDFQVIFRDFKTSNVLLDEDFNPKLSDFGLARQGPQDGDSHVSTAVVGTAGYAAPEYIQTGHLTVKSDVWSFGIVMLEVLTGRRVMDRNRPKNEQRLVDWARPYTSDHHKLYQIMDPLLNGRYPVKQAQRFARLAYQCLSKLPKNRPKMSDVVDKLKSVQEGTFQWESPSLLSPSQGNRGSPEVRSLSLSQELSRPSKGSPLGLALGSLPAVQSGKVSKFSPKVSDNADVSKQMSTLSLEGSSHSRKSVDTSGVEVKPTDTSTGKPELVGTVGEKLKLVERVGEEPKPVEKVGEEPNLVEKTGEEPKLVEKNGVEPKAVRRVGEDPTLVDSAKEDPLSTSDVPRRRSRYSDRLSRMSRESGRFTWIPKLSFSTS